MKLNPDQIRQGDVMLVRVDKRPRWAKHEAQRVDGKLVAEFGESSGHGHRIAENHVAGFRATSPEMQALVGIDYIEVGGSGAVMRHEFSDGRPAEHDPITLPPGKYERCIQVEYDPEEERRIAD